MPEKEISLAPLPFFNPRRKVLLIIFSGLFILIAVCLWGFFMNPELYGPNYAAKRLSPSLVHLFGTDQLGRDMFYRTISGLSLSIQIGLLSAVLSSFIALVLGSMSAIYGGKVDYIINYLVDLCMGVPHLILLILISIACNGSYTLAGADPCSQSGSHAGTFRQVRPTFEPHGKKFMVYRSPAYYSPCFSTIYSRPDTAVSPCHPS